MTDIDMLLRQRNDNYRLVKELRFANLVLWITIPCWWITTAAFIYVVYFR